MSENTIELNRLRALRNYYFRQINIKSTDIKYITKANQHIEIINKRIAELTNKPVEQIISEGTGKRGRPRKN